MPRTSNTQGNKANVENSVPKITHQLGFKLYDTQTECEQLEQTFEIVKRKWYDNTLTHTWAVVTNNIATSQVVHVFPKAQRMRMAAISNVTMCRKRKIKYNGLTRKRP